ncbi:unnamed protein product [Scytosiphon promiscuus]
MEHNRRSGPETTAVINNGRGRSDVFLRTARVQERVADRRPPSTRNLASSTSVRINAVDDSVYFFRVNALSYIGLAVVNIGLVVAGLIVLPLHWGDDDVCDASFRSKWRWWALVLILRKAIVTPAHLIRWRLFLQPPEERDLLLDHRSKSLVQLLEWLGFVYFIFGHVYLLQSRSCKDPLDSPIFQLSVAIIIFKYLRYTLPFMVICFLGPAAICCLPCVIRVMTMLQDQEQLGRGPLQQEIDGLPTVKYGETESIQDDACAICLVAYLEDDELKKLPCNHAFHTSCTDSWLTVNASCPICRTHCFETPEGGQDRNDAGQVFVGDTLA